MRTDMFLNRHLGPNEEEIRKMLQKIDFQEKILKISYGKKKHYLIKII